MGLTIHWKLAFKGSESIIKERLGAIRELGLALQRRGCAISVSNLWELDYSKDFNDEQENRRCGGEEQEGYRWAKIQCTPRYAIQDTTMIPQQDEKRHKGYVVCICTDRGSEPTNIGLVSKDGENWVGNAFTKTQYAEHFVKSHLTVVAILDACKQFGILASVSDEGEYWETRDVKVLGENINESTAFIKQMGGMIAGLGFDKVDSSIKESENYVKTEGVNGRTKKEHIKNRRF